MTQLPRPGRHHLPGDPPSASWPGTPSPSWQQAPSNSWQQVPYQPPPVAEPPKPEVPALSPSVRGRTLDRSIQVNASHARNAADRIGTRDALGEHALILYSVDETARPFRLSTATRLDYEEHRGEDLPALLQALTTHAWTQIQGAHRAGRRWDPRTPMEGLVLRSDEVTPATEYVGLGISTLDTPGSPWRDTKRTVTSADGLNLAGQGWVLLKDGTAMYFLRQAQMGGNSGQHTIITNRPVHSIYRPRLDNELIYNASLQETAVWQGLEKLHQVLMSA